MFSSYPVEPNIRHGLQWDCYYGVAVLVFFFLLFFGCVDPDAPMDPSNTSEVIFEVPKGATANRIGPRLVEAGLIPSEFKWKMFLRQRDASCLKAGRFPVSPAMSMNDLIETLCGVPLANDVAFTVLEGWRIRDIDQALVNEGLARAGVYQGLAESKGVTIPFDVSGPTLEGYLWPETYMVSPDQFSPKDFIERQLRSFDEQFRKKHVGQLGSRSLHEVVIMASMLEREEPTPKNRPLVAGILWKRLDKGWQLGVDATSRYTLSKWNDRKAFLKKLRDPKDPYNTRLNKGLPKTAIGNPSASALDAAITPEDSEFWYYLHDSKKVLHPSRNAAEHEAYRKKYNVY